MERSTVHRHERNPVRNGAHGDRPETRWKARLRSVARATWLAPVATLALLAQAAWADSAPTCATPDDLATLTAARERIAAHGANVWPGWKAAPPILLRVGEVDCLIGHPAPPADFVPVSADVAELAGHLIPVPAATAWPVADVWSVAVPARDELQAFLDEHLGDATLEVTPSLYERTITHEAFHAFQMTVLGGPNRLPDFGTGDAQPPRLEDLARAAGIDAAMREQGRHLVAALRAETAGDAAHAAAAFLDARAAWRAVAPAGTDALERQLEFLEGTARYADVLLSAFPPAPSDRPADDGWQDLIAQLEDLPSVDTGIRDRYAALGAGQAFVLDRLLPGWKRRAIPGGASLEALLHDAVEGRASVPARLSHLPLVTARLDGQSLRLLIAAEPEAWARGLQDVVSLGGVDGLLFVFPEDVHAPFWMRGAVVPLDIAFFAADGTRLARMRMPLCDADPCPTFRPEVPYRYALETLAGRLPAGRVLDLDGE